MDPDETAHYEPSHLDLFCLHRYWFWSAGLKELDTGVSSPYDRLLNRHFQSVNVKSLNNKTDSFETKVSTLDGFC